MATSRGSVHDTSSIEFEEEDAFVYVFDRRDHAAPEIKIETGGLFTFDDFKDRVREVNIRHCVHQSGLFTFFKIKSRAK